MIFEFLSSEFALRLGWTLVHSFWQIAIVGAVAAVLLSFIPGRLSSLRYSIVTCALGFVYLPLLATFVLTGDRLSVNSGIDSSFSTQDALAIEEVSPSSATMEKQKLSASAPGTGSHDSPQRNHHFKARVANNIRVAFSTSLPWLVGIWCTGVVVLGSWNAGGWFILKQMRTFRSPVNESVRKRLDFWAQRLGVHQRVEIAESLLVDVPVVIGWLRPLILLPASLVTGISTQQLDAILIHELAHVQRRDYLVNLFQLFTETLLFYHPVVWLISRQIRKEREFCCDDTAISNGTDRTVYVGVLAAIESSRLARAQALSMAGNSPGMSVRRARRIMDTKKPPRQSWIVGMGALLLLLFTMLSVAFCAVDTAETESEARLVGQTSTNRNEDSGKVTRPSKQHIHKCDESNADFQAIQIPKNTYQKLHKSCRQIIASYDPYFHKDDIESAIRKLSRDFPHLVQLQITKQDEKGNQESVVNWKNKRHSDVFGNVSFDFGRRANNYNYTLIQSRLSTDDSKHERTPLPAKLASREHLRIKTVFVDDNHGPWGANDNGVQIRLRCPKSQWSIEELPTFTLDVRNGTPQQIVHIAHPGACEIEVDGIWYESQTQPASAPGSMIPIGATVASNIDFKLPTTGASSVNAIWVAKEGRHPLILSPGQHRLRIALRGISDEKDKEFELNPVSNEMLFSVHKTVYPPR